MVYKRRDKRPLVSIIGKVVNFFADTLRRSTSTKKKIPLPMSSLEDFSSKSTPLTYCTIPSINPASLAVSGILFHVPVVVNIFHTSIQQVHNDRRVGGLLVPDTTNMHATIKVICLRESI